MTGTLFNVSRNNIIWKDNDLGWRRGYWADWEEVTLKNMWNIDLQKKECQEIKQKLYILFGHYLISMVTDYNLLTIETTAI